MTGRNAIDWGETSDEFSILAATLPSQPKKPKIHVQNNGDVKISWDYPLNQGGGPLVVTSFEV